MTIGQLDSGRRNNFDLIRFMAASGVIFYHSFTITSQSGKEPLSEHFKFINFGSLGVYIFFIISGYLITKSFFRQKDTVSYVKARCLRIFPGLAVSILLCALLLGPLVTTLPIGDYLTRPAVYQYILANASLLRAGGGLPGVFEHNSFSNVVNNSIWTLPMELLMYIVVVLAGAAFVRMKARHLEFRINVLVLALVVVYLCLLIPALNLRYLKDALPWIILFGVSALIYFFRYRIQLNLWWMVAGWLLTAVAIGWHLPGFKVVFALTLVYTVFMIGFHPRLYVGHFSKYGDFSYGLYIYGWPIQQTFQMLHPTWSPWTNFGVSYIIALLFAILSWHLVEKPAIRLKNPKKTPELADKVLLP